MISSIFKFSSSKKIPNLSYCTYKSKFFSCLTATTHLLSISYLQNTLLFPIPSAFCIKHNHFQLGKHQLLPSLIVLVKTWSSNLVDTTLICPKAWSSSGDNWNFLSPLTNYTKTTTQKKPQICNDMHNVNANV